MNRNGWAVGYKFGHEKIRLPSFPDRTRARFWLRASLVQEAASCPCRAERRPWFEDSTATTAPATEAMSEPRTVSPSGHARTRRTPACASATCSGSDTDVVGDRPIAARETVQRTVLVPVTVKTPLAPRVDQTVEDRRLGASGCPATVCLAGSGLSADPRSGPDEGDSTTQRPARTPQLTRLVQGRVRNVDQCTVWLPSTYPGLRLLKRFVYRHSVL